MNSLVAYENISSNILCIKFDISAYFIKILFEGFNSEFNFLPSESLFLSCEL